MTEEFKNVFKDAAKDFKLPKYNEIPSVGLYLEQTAKYISEINYNGEPMITGSMISNYVKKGLISNPVKKQYSRDQIAYLIFIAMAKCVLSMEDIKLLIEMQKQSYSNEIAYNYLVEEFENVVGYVFGLKDEMETIGRNNHEVKIMLRNLIITVAHKAYLDVCFKYYRNKE
ncbi:MAG: DUF1836 domain-containing protein [Clostridia bacterium]|nr:DUF1836 domain-containing protein [Clostridia bacterium]